MIIAENGNISDRMTFGKIKERAERKAGKKAEIVAYSRDNQMSHGHGSVDDKVKNSEAQNETTIKNHPHSVPT